MTTEQKIDALSKECYRCLVQSKYLPLQHDMDKEIGRIRAIIISHMLHRPWHDLKNHAHVYARVVRNVYDSKNIPRDHLNRKLGDYKLPSVWKKIENLKMFRKDDGKEEKEDDYKIY